MSAPRAFVPAASGPRGTAEAYLTKELLPSLAPDLVRFLEESSVFETLDLRVLETINAFVGVRAWITRLQRAGALLTEVRLERYRLHPLLRELAQRRLRKRRGEDGAHRRAAEAYARAGEIAAALFHAASAGDAETAGTFLRLYAEAAIATGHYDHVFALARRIDAGGADADARFYAEGLLEKVRGSSDAQTLFQRAAESAVMSGDAAIAFSARAQIVEHDLGHLLSVDRDALTELHRRAETLGVAAQATVAVLRGWAFAIAHDFSNALSCAEPLASTDVTLIRFNSGVLVAYAQTALGRIDAAQETLDALIRLLENDDRVVLQTLTLVWFARLALAWGRTSAAADAAAAAARLASALDLRAEEAALYVALAEIATHNGNVQQAVQYAERARRSAERAWYVADTHRVQAFAEIALARAAFLGHDNTIARDLALRAAAAPNIPTSQRAVALTEAAVYTLLCDVSASAAAIANARSAVAEATPVDAADAIAIAVSDDILAFLDAADSTAHERLLGACAPFATLLEQRRGLVTLEMAGVAVGNARRGTGSSVAFETALELLTRDGPRFEAYLARAYASRFIKSKRPPVPAVNLDLTPREFEIVSLLVDGLTNKEIAQRLILSPRTIETHVERVLGKLEVGSRSRAIAKALRLGLVSLESSVPAP